MGKSIWLIQEEEEAKHNQEILSELHYNPQDFEDLMDGCYLNGKMEWVSKPKGNEQSDDDIGVFKNIHVDQWATGMSGDSYAGFIYAQIGKRWLKIPYSC